MKKYTVYGVNSMGSTWYLCDKNADRCRLWIGAPKEMRTQYDTYEEARKKADELDHAYRFGSTRHHVEEMEVET